MSRGGRGGRGGFRGGRGGFGGSSNMPPMGLTFADIQALSREATALYPPVQLPILTDYSEEEKRIAELQVGFADRLRKSAYYVVEKTKSTELPKYSDKYRTESSHPTLKRSDFHQPFFPNEIFEDYFNPRRKKKAQKNAASKRLNIDEMNEDEEAEKSEEERSDAGSQEPSDYDVDEEYDNDYAENYFDNGEGDDNDDLGDGFGGGGGGDFGGDYD